MPGQGGSAPGLCQKREASEAFMLQRKDAAYGKWAAPIPCGEGAARKP